MAPSPPTGSDKAPIPLSASASGEAGATAPMACHRSSNGRRPRVAIGAPIGAERKSGSRTKPRTARAPFRASASCRSPSGNVAASALISVFPVSAPRRLASAAGERSSASANNTSTASAFGCRMAIASTTRAIVSRGQGQGPSASIDRRSMSTTTTGSSLCSSGCSAWSMRSTISRALSRNSS